MTASACVVCGTGCPGCGGRMYGCRRCEPLLSAPRPRPVSVMVGLYRRPHLGESGPVLLYAAEGAARFVVSCIRREVRAIHRARVGLGMRGRVSPLLHSHGGLFLRVISARGLGVKGAAGFRRQVAYLDTMAGGCRCYRVLRPAYPLRYSGSVHPHFRPSRLPR